MSEINQRSSHQQYQIDLILWHFTKEELDKMSFDLFYMIGLSQSNVLLFETKCSQFLKVHYERQKEMACMLGAPSSVYYA